MLDRAPQRSVATSFNPQPQARTKLGPAGIGTSRVLACGCGLNDERAYGCGDWLEAKWHCPSREHCDFAHGDRGISLRERKPGKRYMSSSKPILGAHMSMAGGFDKAVQRGHEVGCACVQVFTKNNNQWKAPALTADVISALEQAKKQFHIPHVIAHSSYLINLASPDKALWKKSLDAFVVELQRAEQLGIPSVVLHPGAYTSSSERAGLQRVIRALNEVHRQTRGISAQCLLENTAGQGSCLGWRFEHLATILDGVKDPERLGGLFRHMPCLCRRLSSGLAGGISADDARIDDRWWESSESARFT